VSQRISLYSDNIDIRVEEIAMLDLDKHPGLQGGRFAARLWRSNLQCAHWVARGDSLFHLALRYNTTIDALKKHNYLKSDLLHIGQELALPNCAQHMLELTNTRICFRMPGSLVFIDTTTSPPDVIPLRSFTEGDSTCATVSRPGTVVLTALQ